MNGASLKRRAEIRRYVARCWSAKNFCTPYDPGSSDVARSSSWRRGGRVVTNERGSDCVNTCAEGEAARGMSWFPPRSFRRGSIATTPNPCNLRSRAEGVFTQGSGACGTPWCRRFLEAANTLGHRLHIELILRILRSSIKRPQRSEGMTECLVLYRTLGVRVSRRRITTCIDTETEPTTPDCATTAG
jgi:hypothetical protein